MTRKLEHPKRNKIDSNELNSVITDNEWDMQSHDTFVSQEKRMLMNHYEKIFSMLHLYNNRTQCTWRYRKYAG